MFQPARWALMASMLLAACAGVPGRGAPDRFAQSFDSATSGCRQNPALCAQVAGEETVLPQAARRLAEAGASVAAVGMALNGDWKTQIEQALQECAEHARTKVLSDKRQGKIPTQAECDQPAPGMAVKLAIYLGDEMHKEALQCAGERLSQLVPGRFSLEPRYRYDRTPKQTTFISEEEAQSLLRQWRGDELKGTLRPDVVIHSGNPLQVRAVYDFKFPCADGSRPTPWTRYTEGPHQGFDQKQVYWDALGVEPFRIVPWLGILK